MSPYRGMAEDEDADVVGRLSESWKAWWVEGFHQWLLWHNFAQAIKAGNRMIVVVRLLRCLDLQWTSDLTRAKL